jgi:isopropylmalate/homocitrate/citramalate synthase
MTRDISPYNSEDSVDGSFPSFPRKVRIRDITLREGQQAAEVSFSIDEKVTLAARVVEAGIPAIQAGFAGGDEETVRALKDQVPGIEVSVILVAWKDDWAAAAESAAAAGVDTLTVLFRCATRQLAAMGITQAQGQARVREAVAASRALVPRVSFEGSFVTLADEPFLRDLFQGAAEAGATEFGISDTTGVANPEAIGYLVRTLQAATGGDRPFLVHCHDDFGLAVANTLAGLAAGATTADASVLGLGERAGNCPTEELVLALELLYGVDTGVKMDALTAIARYVSEVTGIPIPASKPVVGENVFSQKLDLHIVITQQDPTLLEPYPPGLVGNERFLRLGVGTGPVAVKAKSRQLGMTEISDEEAASLARRINEVALSSKQSVSDAEFRQMIDAEA